MRNYEKSDVEGKFLDGEFDSLARDCQQELTERDEHGKTSTPLPEHLEGDGH